MFIQTQKTPNPQTLRFVPPGEVRGRSPSVEFATPTAAARSPLAARLFAIEGVGRVFFGADFISVTKTSGVWEHLKPMILTTVMEHFLSDAPLLLEEEEEEGTQTRSSFDADIVKILDTHVRPAVAQDGGDVAFVRYADGVVYLRMRGACSGCPSAAATLKQGIETLLRHHFPQIREVREVGES